MPAWRCAFTMDGADDVYTLARRQRELVNEHRRLARYLLANITSQSDWREMAETLQRLRTYALSAWEIRFIENLLRWRGQPTPRQIAALRRVVVRVQDWATSR